MNALDTLRQELPDFAKDVKLNLQSVLAATVLSKEQRHGVAVASAAAARNQALLRAVIADARSEVGPAVVDDGLAAASLMAMNNVYYRFRHGMEGGAYADKPAKLRMNRMVNPSTNKTDFELYSLAVSTIFGCQFCTRAHERVVIEGGLTDEHVHDAVRIAATVHSAAVALDIVAAQRI
jgi:lipoyl-dependent peroxiredoxin subunit D